MFWKPIRPFPWILFSGHLCVDIKLEEFTCFTFSQKPIIFCSLWFLTVLLHVGHKVKIIFHSSPTHLRKQVFHPFFFVFSFPKVSKVCWFQQPSMWGKRNQSFESTSKIQDIRDRAPSSLSDSASISQFSRAVLAAASHFAVGRGNYISFLSAPGEVKYKAVFQTVHWESRDAGCILLLLLFLEREVIGQVIELCWLGGGTDVGKVKLLLVFVSTWCFSFALV